ncbi:preprotein translocase subunit YajC [Pseudonocardia ailaonensis]
MTLLFPILILLLFIPIFLSGRKQKRQVAEQQQMQNALSVGDVVTTTSGLRGTITDVSYEDTIDLEIADGVVTTWLRAAVREKVATDDAVLAEDHTDEHADDASPSALPSTNGSANGSTNGSTNGTATNGSSAATGSAQDAVVEPASGTTTESGTGTTADDKK